MLVRARSCSSPSSAPPTLPLLRCSAAPLLQRRSGGASLPRRSPAPRVRARARQSISLGELRGGGDLHDELEPSGAAPKEATSLGTRAPAGARVAHGHGAPPSWGARGGSWLLGGYTWPARGAPRLRLPAGRGRRGRLPPVRRGAASVARTEGLRRRLPLPVISFFPFSFFQLRSDSRIDILFRKIPQFSVSPSDWTGLQQREGAAAAVLGPRLDSRLSQVSRGPRRRGGGGGFSPSTKPGLPARLGTQCVETTGPLGAPAVLRGPSPRLRPLEFGERWSVVKHVDCRSAFGGGGNVETRAALAAGERGAGGLAPAGEGGQPARTLAGATTPPGGPASLDHAALTVSE